MIRQNESSLFSDVCYLRLDFDTFTILGTGGTTESNGGECQDMFAITVSGMKLINLDRWNIIAT